MTTQQQNQTDAFGWEKHDDGEEGAFVSPCGLFETSMDQVYGFLRLHLAEDTTESLAESQSLAELGEIARRHPAFGTADAGSGLHS